MTRGGDGAARPHYYGEVEGYSHQANNQSDSRERLTNSLESSVERQEEDAGEREVNAGQEVKVGEPKEAVAVKKIEVPETVVGGGQATKTRIWITVCPTMVKAPAPATR